MAEDQSARESLDRASRLSGQMRKQGRWHRAVIAMLGATAFALIVAAGILPASIRAAAATLALLCLMGLVVYSASRRVVPRHHRLLYSLVTPVGALLFTLTVLLGWVYFAGVWWWWIAGATASTLPFWTFVIVNTATAGNGEDRDSSA
ncbi:hypothetical protein [Nonomuraea typhae]|uniref:DUF3040 domain-containing protein n=1 Tax=Nonomuraea typhae TaxID=2603600 RepID=A0ABW7YUP9_9ACTN